jgi:hypothetical protein
MYVPCLVLFMTATGILLGIVTVAMLFRRRTTGESRVVDSVISIMAILGIIGSLVLIFVVGL